MSNRVFSSSSQWVHSSGYVAEIEVEGDFKQNLLNGSSVGAFEGDSSSMEGAKIDTTELRNMGNLNDVMAVRGLLEKLRGDIVKAGENTSDKNNLLNTHDITVTYNDDAMFFNAGSAEDVYLTDDLLQKIINTDISHATIKVGDHLIKIEEGKVSSIEDGHEDRIPQSVIDASLEYMRENDMVQIAVVPFEKRENVSATGFDVQYMFTDVKGNVLEIATADGPNGGIIFGNSSSPSYNPDGSGASIVIDNSNKAPHMSNQASSSDDTMSKLASAIENDQIPRDWSFANESVLVEHAETVLRHIELEEEFADIQAQLAEIDVELDLFLDDKSDLSVEESMKLLEKRDEISIRLEPTLKQIREIKTQTINPLEKEWMNGVDELIKYYDPINSKINNANETGEKPSFTEAERAYLDNIKGTTPISPEKQEEVQRIIEEANPSAQPKLEEVQEPAVAMTAKPQLEPIVKQQVADSSCIEPVSEKVDDDGIPLETKQLFDEVDDLLNSRPDLIDPEPINPEPAITPVNECTPTEREFSHKYEGEIIKDPNIGEVQQALLKLTDLAEGLNIDLGNTGDGRGVDNALGPKTTAGIEAAQEYLGLEVNGIADSALLSALEDEVVALDWDSKFEPEVLVALSEKEVSCGFNSSSASPFVPLERDLSNAHGVSVGFRPG